MLKVLTVVGARPQFVKAAAVSRALAKAGLSEVLVHTGQHYDWGMSDVFFEQMEIPHPAYNLGIGGGLHGAMTGQQLEKIEEILLIERPDRVLVYGDTNSTLAGALAAVKLHIPVAHVEAGLRSFNRRMPEEVNRILVDHSSTQLFAPTTVAVDNLAREGISGPQVKLVGDVMYDAMLHYRGRSVRPDWFGDAVGTASEFVLCTIHRAENTDTRERLAGIIAGLGTSQWPVVLPLHPRTRQAISEHGIEIPAAIRIVPPVGYFEMLWLQANCRAVVTDSGGVQKEAYFNRKPCITLRDETEWVELIAQGYNMLVGASPDAIAAAITATRSDMHFSVGLYGSGNAADLIAQELT